MRQLAVILVSALCIGPVRSEVGIHIERAMCAYPGNQISVAITLENPPPALELGGFDLMFVYDSTLLLQTVTMGPLLTGCQWEYLDYITCGTYCARIVAIADIANGSHHPTCYADSSGILAEATFLVTSAPPSGSEFEAIRWMWTDCGDNAVSSRTGDTLYVSDDIFHFDGNYEYLITLDTTLPTPTGVPDACLSGGGGIERAIDFYGGGIEVMTTDTRPPVAYCPADITVGNDPGLCGATVAFEADASDNCPGVTINCVPASGTFFWAGMTRVGCTAVDALGNTDTCGFYVTVLDTTRPIAECPPDTTVDNDSGLCGAVVTFNTAVIDNCPASINCTHASGAFFDIGTTAVTCVAVDGSTNSDICTAEITVRDAEPPIVNCPSGVTIGNDPGQCHAVVDFEASAADNCPGVEVTVTPPAGYLFAIGTTPVQVVAVDVSGNADTGWFDVLVEDTAGPVITCPLDVDIPNDSGEYGAVAGFVLSADDNCSVASLLAVPPSGTLFPNGTTLVTITAADPAGNTDTCVFSVMVTLNDPDGDGRPNWDDNCPQNFNPDQVDTDNDGCGDSCDVCTDVDGDGYGDQGVPSDTCAPDNCPDTYNPDQSDANGDGIGDACCCFARGDVDGIEDINVADLTWLVEYLFRNGVGPPCPNEGDVDGSSFIDVGDLTYLVNYLFQGGPAPPACP
ncbi:MAG: HYR domain-containing protein [bacterium]